LKKKKIGVQKRLQNREKEEAWGGGGGKKSFRWGKRTSSGNPLGLKTNGGG